MLCRKEEKVALKLRAEGREEFFRRKEGLGHYREVRSMCRSPDVEGSCSYIWDSKDARESAWGVVRAVEMGGQVGRVELRPKDHQPDAWRTGGWCCSAASENDDLDLGDFNGGGDKYLESREIWEGKAAQLSTSFVTLDKEVG